MSRRRGGEAAESTSQDWVATLADEVIATHEKEGDADRTIVCASGLSPSGPIHLGNLREVLTPHLVADEIRRRGIACEHLISWDDFDRYRRVPKGVDGIDDSWAEHIGKPLTSVPAPRGSAHENWAEHFKAPMVDALERLGVPFRGISQTQMYTSGAYVEPTLLAMRERARIDEVLGRFRTRKGPDSEGAAEGGDAGVDPDEAVGSTTGEYFPYKPYCGACGTDDTTIVAYDDATTEMTFTCACGSSETVLLREFTRGKLVWKVDWPMRWAFEGVDFEPSGVDHSSPGSSYEVGGLLVREVFGGRQPIGPMYAFVGISGQAKMSSSKGGVPTPSSALEVFEAPLLRWLYARRRPNQAIKVAFDAELSRLYDEWDALSRKVAAGTTGAIEALGHARSVTTAERALPTTPQPVPFRTLTSVVDVTTGDPEQLGRLLSGLVPGDPEDPVTLDDLRPRLDCAEHWVEHYMPEESHTRLLAAPDEELLASLDDTDRESLRLLLEGLEQDWSLDGLTTLVYGVPKVQAGLPMDTRPTDELKAAQRRFFVLLYRLLVGSDTGPRLPTLLLAAGPEAVRRCLTAREH
ncbi:lysine--tRNA ligase [Actinomycetospora sp. TBRC 11914]|uniref:lysine--tRNA ligase n=1 Tax=Actinomycetospora sp. TBRC 11914 TaxID=2729387 RepID=UPI00145CE88C|nr:lysine--tRNA ligase [Actinomycetospora sp. TBRC 11914]NMO91187.1 lysine--tRNA ligase [Actinomycetospora sp. TBRC 11914]